MMGYFNLRLIDPMYALPCDVLDKMGIETEFVRRYRLQQQNATPESDSAWHEESIKSPMSKKTVKDLNMFPFFCRHYLFNLAHSIYQQK